jgi:hypothetical protein
MFAQKLLLPALAVFGIAAGKFSSITIAVEMRPG